MSDETKDADYYKPEEQHYDIKSKSFDEGKNVRLMVNLNINAGIPYTQILDTNGGPPLLIVVVRADTRVTAYGVLKEAEVSITKAHSGPPAASRIAPPSALGRGLAHKLGLH
jgi:uncharacterized protein (UPF0128 family)